MEKCEAMLTALETVSHKMGKYAAVTVESCAYAGTGNVLKIQELLHMCAEHLQENAEHQAAAVLATHGDGRLLHVISPGFARCSLSAARRSPTSSCSVGFRA